MEITKQMAEYVVSNSFADIRPPVVQRAKELVLDTLGSALAGVPTGLGRIMVDYARPYSSVPEASVIGAGFRAPLAYALYANAVLPHCIETEAVAPGGVNPLHSIITALTLGEKLNLSGKGIIEGFVTGFEAASAIAHGCPGGGSCGWMTATIFGVFGCTATAAKMLGLDEQKTRVAMGIAASQAGGLMYQTGKFTHFIEFGQCCRSGVESALLASNGVTAPVDILENEYGFVQMYLRDGDFDLSAIQAAIGSGSFIVGNEGRTPISPKKYPCCYRNHQYIDTMLMMLQKYNLRYEDIAEVQIPVNKYTLVVLHYLEPADGEEARFCLAHAVGAAILRGRVDLEPFTDKAVSPSSEFTHARNKVAVALQPNLPPDRTYTSGTITVRLQNGKQYTEGLMPVRPPSRAEELALYRTRAAAVLPAEQIERLKDLVLALDEMNDTKDLMRLLRQ